MTAPPLRGRVAILGFGNQGEAQALNLRDSGCDVIVGGRPAGPSAARARAQGFEVRSLVEAVPEADVVAILLPDEEVPPLWPEITAASRQRATLVFAHGFNLLYGGLSLPSAADVVLVSPTGPGRMLRASYVAGSGLPAYLAVAQDASGTAWETAESYARGIGSARTRLWKTTVAEETEVDLFGEQVVLCGGMNALVTAAFETLTSHGYAPEIAYLECVHQLKYLADLLHERGIAGMRRGISGTALFGDLTRGPRVIGAESRAQMVEILEEIRSGGFAREWQNERARGSQTLSDRVQAAQRHPIEDARRRAVGEPG